MLTGENWVGDCAFERWNWMDSFGSPRRVSYAESKYE